MKLQQLLDLYPRVRIADASKQEEIFTIIDQTSISSASLQVSFNRRPDFYSFLKAQGDTSFVFTFHNKDGSPQGFAASSFRQMKWKNQNICLGYTSDLRTTPQLDREARLQWRKFYGHGVQISQQIDEFRGCQGFVTAVWNENRLAQKALVSKKRPTDFSYEMAITYRSHSIWGRWRPLSKPKEVVRPIRESEIPELLQLLCHNENLSWNEDDLARSIGVFHKTFHDFYVLEEQGRPAAFVLPASTSHVKQTLIKKWPPLLDWAAKLLPHLGKRKIELDRPIEILQMLLFKSISGDADKNLMKFVDHFWYQNNLRPLQDQFNIIALNRWDRPEETHFSLGLKGYLSTAIDGALYKVTTETASTLFQEIKDFSHLEVGFL